VQPYHSPPIGSFRNCTIAALWIFLQFTIFTIYMECRWISVNLYYSLERTRYYPLFSTILLPLWFKIHIISFLRDSSYGFVFNFCYPPPSPHYQTILLSPQWIQSVICLIISLWNSISPLRGLTVQLHYFLPSYCPEPWQLYFYFILFFLIHKLWIIL